MKRRLWIAGKAVLVAAGAFLVFTSGLALAQDLGKTVRITQVDTDGFPEVVVYVSVVDAAGEPAGVQAGQLVVAENGVEIAPDSVEGLGVESPITTLLLVDVSGSMNVDNKLEAAKNAALSYVENSRENDRIGLIAFNTQVSVVQEITADMEMVREGINSLEGIYDTAMLDALQQGVEMLRAESGRRAVIVLTDGLDNQSRVTLEEVLLALMPQDVSVSTIGFGNREHDQSAMSAINEEMLQQIAQAGGGLYSYAADEQALQEIYSLYSRALQSEYVLRYTSPSELRDGFNRLIEVHLADPAAAVAGSAGEQGAIYNPGGVVPESAGLAPWPQFFLLLSPLVLLLALPLLVQRIALVLPKGKSARGKKSGGSRGRIRLH